MSTEDRRSLLSPNGSQRPKQSGAAAYWALLRQYVAVNLKGEMEFRASFVSQIAFMVLNNVFAMFFWVIFFSRFGRIQGWHSRDVLLLWAVGAAGFGLTTGVCGNAMRIQTLIAQGQLDYYLTLPKNTLFQVLMSRMSASAWGDTLFGVGLGLIVLRAPGPCLLYLVMLVPSTIVVLSFFVTVGSTAFWTGSSEGMFWTAFNAVVSFSLYPDPLFTGVIRVLLYTALPAGFITYVPVGLLRSFGWGRFVGLFGFAALLAVVAYVTFSRGLRRYESGNLVGMRM